MVLRKTRKECLSYEEAKELIKQKFPDGCSKNQYKIWVASGNFPENLPKDPPTYYVRFGTWISFRDYGNNIKIRPRRKEYISYNDAKEVIKKHFPNGCSNIEYKNWVRTKDFPENMYINPWSAYKNRGWVDWNDYLSQTNIKNGRKILLSYEEAKNLIKETYNRSITSIEYYEWLKSSTFPNDKLPRDPAVYYRRRKTWKGWKDFCGISKQHIDLTGYVYVITNSVWPNYIKIGSAKHLMTRLAQYNVGDPFKQYICNYRKFFNNRIKIEIKIHDILKDYRVDSKGEWFKISIDDAIKIIEDITE